MRTDAPVLLLLAHAEAREPVCGTSECDHGAESGGERGRDLPPRLRLRGALRWGEGSVRERKKGERNLEVFADAKKFLREGREREANFFARLDTMNE